MKTIHYLRPANSIVAILSLAVTMWVVLLDFEVHRPDENLSMGQPVDNTLQIQQKRISLGHFITSFFPF